MKRITTLSKTRIPTAYIRQGPFLTGLQKVLDSQLQALNDKDGKSTS